MPSALGLVVYDIALVAQKVKVVECCYRGCVISKSGGAAGSVVGRDGY